MLLTNEMLDNLIEEAVKSERLRMNLNLHESVDESVQRLFNAMEPETKIPIHRHLKSSETIIVLRGKLSVSFYDSAKNITETYLLEVGTGNFGVQIPKDTWHGVNVLEPGTVIFEVKEGPYEPLNEFDILS